MTSPDAAPADPAVPETVEAEEAPLPDVSTERYYEVAEDCMADWAKVESEVARAPVKDVPFSFFDDADATGAVETTPMAAAGPLAPALAQPQAPPLFAVPVPKPTAFFFFPRFEGGVAECVLRDGSGVCSPARRSHDSAHREEALRPFSRTQPLAAVRAEWAAVREAFSAESKRRLRFALRHHKRRHGGRSAASRYK